MDFSGLGNGPGVTGRQRHSSVVFSLWYVKKFLLPGLVTDYDKRHKLQMQRNTECAYKLNPAPGKSLKAVFIWLGRPQSDKSVSVRRRSASTSIIT